MTERRAVDGASGSTRMQVARLPGDRLHLSDGPIDLILWAAGETGGVERAYRRAVRRFASVLDELVSELPLLRSPVHAGLHVEGPVAARMLRATRPHEEEFLTPMIAVAGSVADEILQQMLEASSLRRAYVNNGGDIALHLAAGETLRIGIAETPSLETRTASVEIEAELGVRGVATSGMDGRSASLGIADAVSVLAKDAASADTAATLIANAVDVDHPAVERLPATELDPESDLGERLVAVARGSLPTSAIDLALARGAARAEALRASGSIVAAYLACEGQFRAVGSASRIAA